MKANVRFKEFELSIIRVMQSNKNFFNSIKYLGKFIFITMKGNFFDYYIFHFYGTYIVFPLRQIYCTYFAS